MGTITKEEDEESTEEDEESMEEEEESIEEDEESIDVEDLIDQNDELNNNISTENDINSFPTELDSVIENDTDEDITTDVMNRRKQREDENDKLKDEINNKQKEEDTK